MRRTALLPALAAPALLLAQPTVVQQGAPFNRAVKGGTGDLYTVVDGHFAADGRHLLYVEEGLVPKAVRLDAQLQPAEELVLKDVPADGLKWTGVLPVMDDGGRMRVLLVSPAKKGSEFAMAEVGPAMDLQGLRRIAAFDMPYANDPANTLVARPLPDPILFTRGLAYAQRERLIAAPDGEHWLLNHFTHGGKGNKRLGLAWLDKELTALWQSTVELPYADTKSTIHQIAVEDDGTVRLLVYVFNCKDDAQLGDKACHELHLATITENGRSVSDLLIEKDFVSSARMRFRRGQAAVAVRYGALTGKPGIVAVFDPADPKLKPVPLLAQRLPSIRKARLMAYGDPAADPRRPPSRTAKVPDEVVDLLAAPDGSLIVAEAYLEHEFALPMGDALAIRRLAGPIRLSQVQANDSIGWQRTVDRALMTTAGQAYDGSAVLPVEEGLLLLHGHTPKGYEAILRAGAEAAGTKELRPAEPQVLKAAVIGLADGAVRREGTALMMEDGFVPCPMGTVLERGGTRALVKSHDRGTGYRFTVIDLQRLGTE